MPFIEALPFRIEGQAIDSKANEPTDEPPPMSGLLPKVRSSSCTFWMNVVDRNPAAALS
jgi:hypothetical protein